MKNMAWKRVLCKKESDEASMLIWTNCDSFGITHLSRLLQKDIVLNSLQILKGLELAFRPQFL